MNRFPSSFAIILLGAVTCLGVSPDAQDKPDINTKKEKPMMECHIISKTNSVGRGEVAEYFVEIKNGSGEAIVIKSTKSYPLLEHLVLEVRRPDGTTSNRKCGDHLSPGSPTPDLHTIIPGGTLKEGPWKFPGLPDVPAGSPPGLYKIRAIFAYENIKAVSPELQIELKEAKKN